MKKLLLFVLCLAGMVSTSVAQSDVLVIDDFEQDELFESMDEYGNGIGFIPYGDVSGNVELSLMDSVRDGSETGSIYMEYNIRNYGGFSHVFTDGSSRTPMDWTAYNALTFWFKGSATGAEVQVEIYDNLNPDSTGDTAERFYYRFRDESEDWILVEIPFVEFRRRSDWQPNGSLNDGLTLNAVTGYGIDLPKQTGDAVATIDDIQLAVLDGVAFVENEFPEEDSDSDEIMLLVDDFEQDDLVSGQDEYGNDTGYVAWGDTPDNVALRLSSQFRLGAETTALFMRYDIVTFGGFSHIFTDGETRTPQDWTAYNSINFWFLGNDTGAGIQFEILDNLNPDLTGDTAERWAYYFVDDSKDWKYVSILFDDFQRRGDWQPEGALNDGFNLDAVTGYTVGLPAGIGSQRAFIDDIQVALIDIPVAEGELSLDADVSSVAIDESIGWDSRELNLVWSDEFDADAGEPINEDYWTCDTGGWGWGNNEAEYYTCRTENVAHDGNGNLVITAIEEDHTEDTCWYGNCTHTSARITTKDKVEFMFGRVEARIQIPRGAGMWPAFWMLGAEFPDLVWPDSGEIDIMENIGSEPWTVHGSLHGPGYSGGAAITDSYNGNVTFADDFHVFAIDWDPYVIRWYVDGELYNVISVNDMNGREWVYNQDFFILMNVAVGGNMAGYPPPSTEFPQEMLIDYVRVYEFVD